MKTLVENKYGHGAIHNPLKSFLRKTGRRLIRRHIAAKSSQPFDWTTGVNTIQKIGGIKIKDQGQNFSCGRQAGSYAQFILRSLQGINEGEISAKSGYGQYCAPGGGMDIKSLETDMGAWGANLESAVPSYDLNENPLSEADMEDTSWSTPQKVSDALSRAGFTPYNVSIDMNSIALAIQNYGFVIWMIQGQNNGTWDSNNPQPPSPQNPNELWEHYMCAPIAGLKGGQPTITALNSWGVGVGTGGYQDFTQNYFDSGRILEVITFIKDTSIKPVGVSSTFDIWQSLCVFFRQLSGLPA